MSKRLQKELAKILKDPPNDIRINVPDESNLNYWDISIKGPVSTPYEGGNFDLSFTFPENYPFKPPTVLFKTKIYHPNISSESGEICAVVLYDEWSPTLNVLSCLEILRGLLSNPNADSPLEEKIAAEFRERRIEYEKTAKRWTEEHAK